MIEAGLQIKFEKFTAIISEDDEIIATANRASNLFEMKIAIEEKSANTSKAAKNFKKWLKLNFYQEVITGFIIQAIKVGTDVIDIVQSQ